MYSEAYIDYLAHFHGIRDYFECHEILEEHWKQDPRGRRKTHWVGLIQIAVGLYHHRRGNFAGAARMIQNAKRIAISERIELETLAIDVDQLLRDLTQEYHLIESRSPYNGFDLPLTSKELLQQCQERCQELGCAYGTPSDLTNDDLIHRHSRRDRTEVLVERNHQFQIRHQKRNG
ncbi:DUF309 domain-containing protein [Pseudalkalibacillus hwajinpoensis]|uniref:DUF309 domain-containing protein n=1 Tax=Guptibacillus hwajinpoensis TaxID=208199 RepID=UPI00325BAD11